MKMFEEPQRGKVILYSVSYCPYCTKAERLLTQNAIPFTKIDITGREEDFAKVVKFSGGRKTVPQIFFGIEHIGGYDDLERLSLGGDLFTKLKENDL